jgi:hypothetical protein
MKLKLNVKDRLLLLSILPGQGNLSQVRLIRETQLLLGFSAADHKVLKFETVEGGGMKWDGEAAKDKVFDIAAPISALLLNTFEKLQNESKLSIDHLDIYEKLLASK